MAVGGLLDTILHLAGLYDTPNVYRLVSGISVGLGLGMVVFSFITELETVQAV
jgi:uncharacterized membrane protein